MRPRTPALSQPEKRHHVCLHSHEACLHIKDEVLLTRGAKGEKPEIIIMKMTEIIIMPHLFWLLYPTCTSAQGCHQTCPNVAQSMIQLMLIERQAFDYDETQLFEDASRIISPMHGHSRLPFCNAPQNITSKSLAADKRYLNPDTHRSKTCRYFRGPVKIVVCDEIVPASALRTTPSRVAVCILAFDKQIQARMPVLYRGHAALCAVCSV